MKTHRRAMWNKAIESVVSIEPNIRYPLLSLKRLDAEIWARTPRLISIREHMDQMSNDEHTFLQKVIGDAFFWALGAYEITRTLDQRCKVKHAGSAISGHFQDLKHTLELVRVPLAKIEAPRRSPDGYSYAKAFLLKEKGYGWGVSPGNRIVFTEMSDKMVTVLTSYQSSVKESAA